MRWFFTKSELQSTPSIVDGSGVTFDQEINYRKEGARFIMDLGNNIGLRYDTVATGVVFLHRFYMFHSFKEFDRYVTACCCLFLAGKVEETPKKCRDIIKTAKSLLSEAKFAAFGSDPKEEVMTMERVLLQTIKFDFQVEHPYTYLIKYAKCLKGDNTKREKCVQMAWTFVNDSLCTTLCLQWEPEVIAIALVYLAGKLSKFEVVNWVGRKPHHLRWWDMFVEDMSMELLEDVCHQVLDLYTQSNRGSIGSGPTSSPLTPTAPASSHAASGLEYPSKSAPPPDLSKTVVTPKKDASKRKLTPPVLSSSIFPAKTLKSDSLSGNTASGEMPMSSSPLQPPPRMPLLPPPTSYSGNSFSPAPVESGVSPVPPAPSFGPPPHRVLLPLHGTGESAGPGTVYSPVSSGRPHQSFYGHSGVGYRGGGNSNSQHRPF